MGKDDIYFAIGTLLAVLALFGMDWKLVRGRLSVSGKPKRRERFLLVAVIGSLAISSIGWYQAQHPNVTAWKFPKQTNHLCENVQKRDRGA